MSPSVAAAIRAVEAAIELLKVATSDTEPAPVSVVLTRDRSSGRIHRRFRVEGIEGLASYESDNLDAAGIFDVIHDLSNVSDDLDLCQRCFGLVDRADEAGE